MLKQLRQKKTMKRILWALAILIIPAFVLWGAGGLRESQNCAGVIFGKKISFDQFRNAYRAARTRALLLYGSQFQNMQDKIDMEKETWHHLIMVKAAKDRHIKVDDKEIITRIASYPFFQNKDGSFSREAYETILRNAFRVEPRTFEEDMRQAMLIEKLIRDVFKGLPEPTDEEIGLATAKEAEEINKDEDEKNGKEEESPEERRERIKKSLDLTKRFEIFEAWQKDLLEKANLVSNLKKEEELPEEDTKEEKEPEVKVTFGNEKSQE